LPKVDADPDELRQTAQLLRRFKSEVEQQLGRVTGKIASMSGADPQQRRFAAEWDKTAKSLRSFLAAIDSHAPYLERKAQQLEDYLR
jgi:ubiquinone biosynthesis protein UbiJ